MFIRKYVYCMKYRQQFEYFFVWKKEAKVSKHHLEFILAELFGKHFIYIVLSVSQIKTFAILFTSNKHLVALAHLATLIGFCL